MSESAKKRPEYTDFNVRADDDVWREAQVIWYWMGIPVPPGHNATYIANIARSLQTYRKVRAEANAPKAAKPNVTAALSD